MKLTQEQINKIYEILDSDEFRNNLYLDSNGEQLSKEKKSKNGMFYTPGKICIQMIEKYNCDSLASKAILDPTCGSGNLLIACLIAGADSDKVFGNEYDADIIPTCRHRLNRACDILGKPHIRDWQIHRGNALQKRCLTDFSEEYLNGSSHYQAKYIDDQYYAQSNKDWRWENERAKKRLEEAARKKAKAERETAEREQAKAFAAQFEQLNLFDF